MCVNSQKFIHQRKRPGVPRSSWVKTTVCFWPQRVLLASKESFGTPKSPLELQRVLWSPTGSLRPQRILRGQERTLWYSRRVLRGQKRTLWNPRGFSRPGKDPLELARVLHGQQRVLGRQQRVRSCRLRDHFHPQRVRSGQLKQHSCHKKAPRRGREALPTGDCRLRADDGTPLIAIGSL